MRFLKFHHQCANILVLLLRNVKYILLGQKFKYLTYIRCKLKFFWTPPLHVNELKKGITFGFNLKVRYKALNDRTELTGIFCDRIRSREYVSQLGFDRILPRAYQIGNNVSQIAWESFPREFVFKVSHGSGGIIIVTDDAKRGKFPRAVRNKWRSIITHPNDLDLKEASTWIINWLNLDYTFLPLRDNLFGYSVHPHQFIVEEYLRPESSELIDFEFFCYHGKVEIIRNKCFLNGHRMAWYDLEFNEINIVRPDCSPFVPKITKPANLDQAIRIAESLASGRKLSRDYVIENRYQNAKVPSLRESLVSGGGLILFALIYIYTMSRLNLVSLHLTQLRVNRF
jgi:TupA-like ATPgrasp